MADAVHFACFDGVGFVDHRRAGESRRAGHVGLELPGADAADRTRFALCAVHVARRAGVPGVLLVVHGAHAKLVALDALEGEAGRWNFIILISCRWCCSHRWRERCCCCSCRATAKTRIASSAIYSLSWG